MDPASRDIERQPFGGAKDLEIGLQVGDPLLPWPSGSRSWRRRREAVELDDIPPIIKSANGNIFWADEQCTRRVGLTSTEARLFLRLLQVDEPEDYNYGDCKAMFDNFGKEQARLQELMKDLPWWRLWTHRQKKIWEARVEWLARMNEPRPWLLFLMARRRRILIQAADRVLQGLRKKSEARTIAGFEMQHQERGDSITDMEKISAGRVIIDDGSKTAETPLDSQPPKDAGPLALPPMVNYAIHTSDTRPKSASKLMSTMSRIQHGFKGHRDQPLPEGHSPLPDHASESFKPWEATRQDIKRQVEKLMPKPKPYIVIGWFRRSTNDPKELILQFEKSEQLFSVLRSGERDVRGWRDYCSMKSLQGFGLYQCDITRGAHIPLTLTTSQKATFSQFYLAYRASYQHPDDTVAIAWQGWVHKNLNNSKSNPLEGEYSLQLIYDWSSYRLVSVIAIPLLLSLAIGGWYMNGHGDVVTAWTLALYIVTAAAAIIGLLAVMGTLNDV